MTKAKSKRRASKAQMATISYRDQYGDEQSHTFATPFKRHGIAEAILNEADRRGCQDIPALRLQLAKHYA